MHQSVVEVGTSVCSNIKDAKDEVKKLRRDMITLAKENGLRLASAATHPFADWRAQEIYPDERYKNIVEDMQLVARANLIFGLHVHIGVEDRETAIHMMNHARYFVPHILALSTNSPFWLGMNTGLKSYRCKVFDKFPRTNIPDYFPSWGEYENFIKLLIKTNCIDNAKKIWWDIRPHPFFNTIEFRVCDIPMRVDETIALAALIQATMAKLYKLYDGEPGIPAVPARADHGEQMARGALRDQWKDDRFRQADRSAGARFDSASIWNSWMTWWMSWDRGKRSSTFTRSWKMGTGADRQMRVFRGDRQI